MPLKHDMETLLVILLGAMTLIAGAVAAFLPPILVNVWPWLIAFGVSLLYPILLYPMLQARRADYEFRALHFAPALILLLWLLFDLLATFVPFLGAVLTVTTGAWSMILIGIVFVLLALFCIKVLRQRNLRLAALLLLLVPYLFLAFFSERQDWDGRLAAKLWGPRTGTGIIAGVPDDGPINPEQQWREALRRMELRRQEIAQEGQSGTGASPRVTGAESGAQIAAGGLPARPSRPQNGGDVEPPKLPTSGPEVAVFAMTMLALYTGAVHRKAIMRRRDA